MGLEFIPNKPIVIAGAGIGGLVAALALQQRGFEVVLYEQARELREVGAGVQISPNGTRVAQPRMWRIRKPQQRLLSKTGRRRSIECFMGILSQVS
jgi:2-polyprenyl-6-methoxyphenol hydroxylase-like FAD-dependent oxidoreductase